MSLKEPNTEIRLFSVPWHKNDGNLIKFDSRSKQTSAFNTYLSNEHSPVIDKYVGENYNIIKDGVVKLDTNMYNINKYNYMMFKNPDISAIHTWWYAYVDKVEWLSYNSCAVYYTLDAWQNYQFDITFKKSYVERSHIPQSDDTIGRWVAPEPVSFPASVMNNMGHSSFNWSPAWMMNTVSTFGVGVGETLPFYYGGYEPATEDATGGYSFPLHYLSTSVEEFIAIYRDTALFQSSHLDEIINLTCVPKWLETKASITQLDSTWKMIDLDTHSEFKVYRSNQLLNQSERIEGYNPKSLACGYQPHNNKLFTSLAKVFVIHNRNGLNIPFKPELFTAGIINEEKTAGIVKKPSIVYDARPINLTEIKCELAGYETTEKEFSIPYGATLGIGYNSNQGLAGLMNKMTAITSAGMAVGSAGVAFGTGNIVGGIGASVGAVQSIAQIPNAFDSEYKQLGSCSDVNAVSYLFVEPQFYDKSPTYAECQIIDEYLDVYGYAIDEVMNINITSRPSWNYIKVAELNANIKAPAEYSSVIKSAFESGCHIWHTSIDNVGNFGLSNRRT